MASVVDINQLLAAHVGPTWRVVAPYFKTPGPGDWPITAAGGAAAGATDTEVFGDNIPGGNGIVLTDVFLQHIDGLGFDFLFWSLRENGGVKEGYQRMIGTPQAGMVPYPVDAVFMPGSRLGLWANNFSGTDATKYAPAQDVRVWAALKGFRFANVGARAAGAAPMSEFAKPPAFPAVFGG